jgi:tetratricopeptide (TPR) repeat protein
MKKAILIAVALAVVLPIGATLAQGESSEITVEDTGEETELIRRDIEELRREDERLRVEIKDESDDLNDRISDISIWIGIGSFVIVFAAGVSFYLQFRNVKAVKDEAEKILKESQDILVKARGISGQAESEWENIQEMSANIKEAAERLPNIGTEEKDEALIQHVFEESPTLRDDADSLYNAAMKGDLTDIKTLDSLADTLFYNGEYDKVIDILDILIVKKPENSLSYFRKGYALGELGRYEEAITAYDEAIRIKPDKHEVYNNKGKALLELARARPREAISAFDEAIRIKPDYIKAHFNKGIALGGLERFEDAIASFTEVIRIKPDDDVAYYTRACAYSLIGECEEMEADLRKAIELDDKFYEEVKTNVLFEPFRAEVDALLEEIYPDK